MIDPEIKKDISEGLEVIVENFNKCFEDWQKKTGCRANFGWSYNIEDQSPKSMAIKTIDARIYTPPDPKWKEDLSKMDFSKEK